MATTSRDLACPRCGSARGSKVVDSRPRLGYIYRRRTCLQCGERYATTEMIGRPEEMLQVQKYAGHLTRALQRVGRQRRS